MYYTVLFKVASKQSFQSQELLEDVKRRYPLKAEIIPQEESVRYTIEEFIIKLKELK